MPILIADAPGALMELCGVNLLDRLLRILQGLGFRRAIVFSTMPEIIGAELAKHSWAREKVVVHLVPRAIGPFTAQLLFEQGPSERFLIVPANIYCDARLLAALCAEDSPAALVDSNPPEFARSLIRSPCGPVLVTKDSLSAFSPAAPFFEELKDEINNGETDIIDAAEEDDYIVGMRRRPKGNARPSRLFPRTDRNGNHLTSLQNANHAKPNYDCRFHHRLQRDCGLRAWPRRARNPRCAHIWYRRWTGREAVPRQNRNDRARQVGTSSRLFDRKFVVGGYRFSFVAKRPISERVLFFRFAHRIALIG